MPASAKKYGRRIAGLIKGSCWWRIPLRPYLFFCVCFLVVKWHWETYIFNTFPFDFLSRLKLRFLQTLDFQHFQGFKATKRRANGTKNWHFPSQTPPPKKNTNASPPHPHTKKKTVGICLVYHFHVFWDFRMGCFKNSWYLFGISFFWDSQGDVLPFLP